MIFVTTMLICICDCMDFKYATYVMTADYHMIMSGGRHSILWFIRYVRGFIRQLFTDNM